MSAAVGNETITQLEELAINARPSLQTMLYDGWVVRFSNGYTKRSNSSNPLYESVLDVDEKIDLCEKLYSDRHLDTIFKLTSASHPLGLDSLLAARGYTIETRSAVLTVDLEGLEESDLDEVALSSEVSEEWFSAFCKMSDFNDWEMKAEKQTLLNIIPRRCFASISNGDGMMVACGTAVLQRDHVGLFHIVTHKDFRRQGHGKKLVKGLLDWAKKDRATRAYLQVMLENKAALELYSILGFREAYRYWYRVKKRTGV